MLRQEEIMDDLFLWKLDSNYILPGVEKTFILPLSSKTIPFLQKALDKGEQVFILMGKHLDVKKSYFQGKMGVATEIKKIKRENDKCYVTVFGFIRASIHDVDLIEQRVKRFTVIDYMDEDELVLREAFTLTLRCLQEYASVTNKDSAKELYTKYRYYDITKLQGELTLKFFLNNFMLDIMHVIAYDAIDFQNYLHEHYVSKNMLTLRRHLNEMVNSAELSSTVLEEKTVRTSDEFTKLEEEMIAKGIPKAQLEIIQEEISALRKENQSSRDRLNGLKYMQTVAKLPWSHMSKEHSLIKAKEILEASHYGMHEAKHEIMKLLAEGYLDKNAKGTVLCLDGPPGVGKTSLARAVAKAMNRPFISLRLGGVSDESFIRGFSRTYTGATPGKMIAEMQQIDSINPVVLLDEIDKVGKSLQNGDVSAALLEMLDPSQNHAFYDRYLAIPYDLSKCLFIATSNNLADIEPALKDRMEIIHLTGYSREEKLTIAKHYILKPLLLSEHLQAYTIEVEDEAIMKLIDRHANEAGIRSLQRKIDSLYKEMLLQIVLHQKKSFHITADNIDEYILGHKSKANEKVDDDRTIGFL